MEKNFLSLIKTRRSVRAYKSEPVPSKALDAVLEAGTYAPTGGGHQSPTIIAITDPKYRREIAKLNAEVMGSNTDPYHRRRFYRLGGFRYIFRCTGGTWKRHSFITDFTLPVCCGYHPNCVFTQQVFRSGWRLECVLDHGSDYSNHFYLCLLQGNSTKPAEPVNSKMNVALRRR